MPNNKIHQIEVTPRQYARLRGISLAAVYPKLWVGKLPARQEGGRWLITVSADLGRSEADTPSARREMADRAARAVNA